MQSNVNPASQFMPFDALKGFREALKKVEKAVEEKRELSEDVFRELNRKLMSLNVGDNVEIEYYYDLEYIKIKGIVKKIDLNNKILYVGNSKIYFDDIVSI